MDNVFRVEFGGGIETDGSPYRYRAANRCIYCNARPDAATELTDEHVIPKGLMGCNVIPKASCKKCQEVINREIEQPLLRGLFKPFRYVVALPGRNQAERSLYVPETTVVDGIEVTQEVHVDFARSFYPITELKPLRFGTLPIPPEAPTLKAIHPLPFMRPTALKEPAIMRMYGSDEEVT